ncbi:MAG: DUF4214 domain-containing protein [Clostridia bacterium]|nr:DUF4214 domain-containing protein [Clostridia bacterium]
MKTKITKIKKLSVALGLVLLIQILSVLFFNIGEVKASENWNGYVLSESSRAPEGMERVKEITKKKYFIKYEGWVVNVNIPKNMYYENVQLSNYFYGGCVSKIVYDNAEKTHGSMLITAYHSTEYLDIEQYNANKDILEFKRENFFNVRLNRKEVVSTDVKTYYLYKYKTQVDHSDMLNDSKRYTFIKRLYLRALHRGASEADLNAHFNKTTLQEAVDIMLSPEAKQKNDLSTNEKFVIYCYDVLLGRQPDAGGKAAWTNALNNGTSRTSVINSFIQSSEFRNMYNK